MRVLHLDEQRGWRGGEQQASYLIRGLADRGHDVFVAGRTGSEFLARDHGVPPERIAAFPFLGEIDLYTASGLARLVRRHAIEIVHAHTSHTHTIACLARRLAGRGRVVVSRRVDFPPSPGWWSRLKYSWPDRFVAISNAIAKVMIDAGIPSDRISVVHSAIDPARLQAQPLSKAELKLPEGAFVIGNVAALVGHKDQATLLHAMRGVVDTKPDAHLLIAGEGPLRNELTALCDRLGLMEHVHFLGYRNDVPALLNSLDLFVMSSKEEGLGTSVLDAMACGIPVVATAAGGIPEMVRHEETGLLVPIGDAVALAFSILAAARTTDLSKRLAANGAEMVAREFHVDSMVQGNLAIYTDLLQTKSGG